MHSAAHSDASPLCCPLWSIGAKAYSAARFLRPQSEKLHVPVIHALCCGCHCESNSSQSHVYSMPYAATGLPDAFRFHDVCSGLSRLSVSGALSGPSPSRLNLPSSGRWLTGASEQQSLRKPYQIAQYAPICES